MEEIMPNKTHSELMTTHAGRSLLEETKRFSNEGKAVGEYVKNSWQYSDEVDHNPTVEIMINQENKSIQIKDDSNGMTAEKINKQFLVLNQENQERREGDFGRGEYGTGKIAGLGIGKVLSVRTVKDNKLNEFEIHRSDCDAAISEKGVKVRWKHQDKQTSEKNGTIINILDFRLKRSINTSTIKKFLQTKTLTETIYKKEINLFLQAEKLEKAEIPFSEEEIILPDEDYKKILGETKLIIRVATRKLDDDERGVNVLARGIHKAFIKNPSARHNEFIFGDCSCDKLIDENQDPPIFDSSRREELNEDNELAKKFKEFININVDKIRKKLEKKANDARQQEKEEALRKEAEKMKNFFNEDYKEQELELQKRAAKARGNIDEKEKDIPSLGETKIVIGKDFNVNVIEGDDSAGTYDGRGEGEGGEGGDGGKAGGKLEKTNEETSSLGKERKSKRKKSGGGFNIIFDNLGSDDHRAKYDDSERTITVNLDHPFLLKIEEMAGDRISTKYMRPAYEAAAFEYAAAVTTQKGASMLLDDTLGDGVIEMQDRVDSLLRKMALLNLFND
jgi:hypothetical protein